jgi:uncharacterized membrane protein YbhN (UPF0104 family)
MTYDNRTCENRERDKANSHWIRHLITAAVVGLVFFFLFRNLATNVEKIRAYPFELNFGFLILSFVCMWAAVLWYGVVWRRILSILEPGHTVSLAFAIQISIYSWLGRYVPGKVVSIVSRAYLARDQQVSRENLYLSSILDAVFAIISGLILSLAFIAIGGADLLPGRLFPCVILLMAGCAVLILSIDSRPFYWGINLLLRVLGRSAIHGVPRMSLCQRTSVIALLALGQSMRGFGFYLFVRALSSTLSPPSLYLMGTFVMAGALGSASIIVPAGLGVREGVLAIGLQRCLPIGMASVFAIASRVWETVADLLLAVGLGVTLQIMRLRKR